MRFPRIPRADDRRKPGEPPTVPLEAGVAPTALAVLVRERLYADRDYARLRRSEWRQKSSFAYGSTLALSATATVILGLSDLDFWPSIGFCLTALLGPISSIEPYFNWRSRWVHAEEALAKWHHIEENLSLYVATTAASDIEVAKIIDFDRERRDVWSTFSQRWIEDRRSAKTA